MWISEGLDDVNAAGVASQVFKADSNLRPG